MKNMPSRQRRARKIVELSFDPESTADFPHLMRKKPDGAKQSTKSVTSTMKESTGHSSNSDTVSAVTRADFQNLGDELREMLRSEAKSVMTSSTDVTMITLLREEMVENRRQVQSQLEIMQSTLAIFQTMVASMTPAQQSAQSDHNNLESASTDSVSPSDDTPVTQPSHEHNTRSQRRTARNSPTHSDHISMISQTQNLTLLKPSARKVQIFDDDPQHRKPASSGLTPEPKKSRRKLDDEFAELRSFPKATDSQSADGGGS